MLPDRGSLKLTMDGAASGNTGEAGFGGMIRSDSNEVNYCSLSSSFGQKRQIIWQKVDRFKSWFASVPSNQH